MKAPTKPRAGKKPASSPAGPQNAKRALADSPTPIEMVVRKGETSREVVARKMVGPFNRHGMVIGEAYGRHLEALDPADKPGLVEYALDVKARAEKAASGDTSAASELLMAQALSLDGIFTEYARIALVNVGKHVDASDRYMRLALKAQANSRATLEALARLHQPREQTVRHVHVNDGGQAIVADEFHHHTGGRGNGKAIGQPQGTGTGAAGSSAALPCPDKTRDGVPFPGDAERAVPDPRREKPGRATRQPERVEARCQVGGDAEDAGPHSSPRPRARRRKSAADQSPQPAAGGHDR